MTVREGEGGNFQFPQLLKQKRNEKRRERGREGERDRNLKTERETETEIHAPFILFSKCQESVDGTNERINDQTTKQNK